MNKLVSKNPVQRFKQGRKIEKFQFGKQVKYKGVTYTLDKDNTFTYMDNGKAKKANLITDVRLNRSGLPRPEIINSLCMYSVIDEHGGK